MEHQIQFLDQMYLTPVVAEVVDFLMLDQDNLVEELEVVAEELLDLQVMVELQQLQEVVTPEAVAVEVETVDALILLVMVQQVVQA